MAGREIPSSIGAAPAAVPTFPWEALQEINERSLELLVQISRSANNPLILPPTVRDLLRHTSPEDRKHAAARPYTLIDLEFRNLPWWEAVRRLPEKQFPVDAGRNALPKRSAVPLARALLMATREAIRADKEIACLMLGLDPQIAELLGTFQITDIDRIAGHQFRHLEFRWLDRAGVWRSLLLSGANPEGSETRRIDARYLQLLAGDLLPYIQSGQNSRTYTARGK